ncbi:hypothetical protein D3C76_541030 [compost metagenome]
MHHRGNRFQRRIAGMAANQAGVVQAVHTHFLVRHGRRQQQSILGGEQRHSVDGFTLIRREQHVIHIHVQPALVMKHRIAQHIRG